MVKKIFKIIAIVLAGFIVIAGGAIGIVALTGGFNEEIINISKLYFDNDPTNVNKQIKILDDEVIKLDFEPLDATNKIITAKVLGNENGVIANLPKDPTEEVKINAGEDLYLDVGKDAKGNNIGGVVTLKVQQGIATAELKVVVDVPIPDNSIYLTGNLEGKDTGKITTSGKTFKMAISNNTQYVYLKSSLINAFFLKSGDVNLKKTYIGYNYYKADGSLYETKDLSDVLGDPISKYNAKDNVYNYHYQIPITTDIAGQVEIWAKTHRTSEIQNIFETEKFGDLVSIIEFANQTHSSKDLEIASLMLAKYNDFINKYIKYFDTSAESYAFFKTCMDQDGKVTLKNSAHVKTSLNYVFVSCSALIDVTAIRLDDFTATSTPKVYNVFEDKMYSISGYYSENIVDTFGLTITTDNESASGADEEKDYMFESLTLKPYLYIQSTENVSDIDDENHTLSWNDRTYSFLPVYGFEGNSPIVKIEEYDEEVPVKVIGFLIRLSESDEFMNVTQGNEIHGEKQWKVSCNVPFLNNQKSPEESSKVLYLGFEVSGISSESDDLITKHAFTRIFVNYEDYDFVSNDVNNLSLNDLAPYMALNTTPMSIKEGSEYDGKFAEKRFTQDVTVKLDGYVENLETVTYTNVMYFVEEKSNVVGDSSAKVATVGKYKFISYSNATVDYVNGDKYQFDGEDLVGLRIPTKNSITQNYCLYALNASADPVKVFAVVYLSDKYGNPIDTNGRLIVDKGYESGKDEDGKPIVDTSTIPSLVVIRISDVSENRIPQVTIESFVDNMNFYTFNHEDLDVGGVTISSGYVNRNVVNYYYDEEGAVVGENSLKLIRDSLRLKLLKDNNFTLYMTNMELDQNGNIADENNKLNDLSFLDVFGKELQKSYDVNNADNKQYAFNKLCKDLSNYSLHTGNANIAVSNPIITSGGIGEDELWVDGSNATVVKWVLTSSESTNSNANPVIYLDPFNSTIPYCNSLTHTETDSSNSSSQNIQRTNYAVYDTYKLEILDVELKYDSMDAGFELQNKIYAKYASRDNSDFRIGQLNFEEKIPNGSGTQNYHLPLVDGEIAYSVKTNLINDGKLNYDFVDMSQALGAIADRNHDGKTYESIYSYINFYTKNAGNTKPSYSAAESVVSFAEDCYFTNIDTEGKYTTSIYFGTKIYPINAGKVNINGYEFVLQEEDTSDGTLWKLPIKKGSYFPMIEGVGAIIYNEIFPIFSSVNNTNFHIIKYDINSQKGENIRVEKEAKLLLSSGETMVYNANNYLANTDDADASAIKVQDESSATVNFLQGEEIGWFAEDQNGTYKKVINQSNANDYEYVKIGISENYEGDRYSIVTGSDLDDKQGVKVYLLITFPIMQGTQYFYKVIEYEILQEEIEVIVYNGGSQVNSNANPLIINAGTTTNISFGVEDFGPYIGIKASEKGNFFDHVNIYPESSEVPGFTGSKNDNNEHAVVTIPHLIDETGFTLKMTYPYKGETKEKKISIKATPDIHFKRGNQVGLKELDDNTKAYSLKLGAGQHNIDNLFENNFEYNTDQIKNIRLSNKETTINSSEISVGSTYVQFVNDKIEYKSEVYNITLILNDGNDTRVELNNKLYIEIIPDKIVDLDLLNNNLVLFNGDNIFYNYIRVFEGNLLPSDLKDTNNIISDLDEYSFITLKPLTYIEDLEGVDENGYLTSGKIELSQVPTEDKVIEFELSYAGLNTPIRFSVKIRGVEMYYSNTGNVTTDPKELKGDVNIEVSSGDSINVADYFSCNLTTESQEVDIVAVLVIMSSDNYTILPMTIENITEDAIYYIGYARTKSGLGIEAGLELVEAPYVLNIKVA